MGFGHGVLRVKIRGPRTCAASRKRWASEKEIRSGMKLPRSSKRL
jgi:hypothetical protein